MSVLVTLALVLAAVWVGRWLWVHYEVEPWTRDGRVRADVAAISPDVSGLVTKVYVADNAVIRRGDVLFVIDRPRFQASLQQAQAAVGRQAEALDQARRELRRDRALGDLVAAETTEQAASRVAELEASLAEARAALATAELNLARTTVRAPVNGTAADVQLRPGDYANVGRPLFGIVDSGSLHVDGYFEETKLENIHVGDRASIRLMGSSQVLYGRVQSISAGITDRERSASPNLLPNVNPTFSYVRLAQRIPVRIQLDSPPRDVRLIAGRTATVVIGDPKAARRGFWSW